MRRLSRVTKISESDKALLAELKRVVALIHPEAQVVLYGSAARGERTADSDYDVLVLTNRRLSSVEERELDRAIYDLQVEKGVVLSAIVCPEEEWRDPILQASPYRKNVLREGVII